MVQCLRPALFVAVSMESKMVLLVFLIVLCSTFAAPLYDGDSCSSTSGNPGVCTLLKNCSTVIEGLKAGTLPETLCGYSGLEPVVCCPVQNTTTLHEVEVEEEPALGGRGYISEIKCAEYAKSVFVLRPSILLGSDRWLNYSQCGVKVSLWGDGLRGADRMEYPHIAAIGYESETGEIHWECSGTLISDKFVLTAYECSFSVDWGNATWVRLGDLHLTRTDDGAKPVDRRISEIIRHPDYKSPELYHGIALFRLESKVAFNGWIRPACLHTASRPENKKAIVTGWGSVEGGNGQTGSRLFRSIVPLVDQETCNTEYNNSGSKVYTLSKGVVENWWICAKSAEPVPCQIEIGGPLLVYKKKQYCMYEIIGVKGPGSCGDRYPRLYSRVSHYVPWIESIVWNEE